MENRDEYFINMAIEMAEKGMNKDAGGPFGCVITKNGEIIAQSHNEVTSTNDPTAHAEVVAIRKACEALDSFQLDGCTLYTSCEPCPMCLGAIYWARPERVVYACSKKDAADAGFDDDFIYQEIDMNPENRKIPFDQQGQIAGQKVFEQWKIKENKIEY